MRKALCAELIWNIALLENPPACFPVAAGCAPLDLQLKPAAAAQLQSEPKQMLLQSTSFMTTFQSAPKPTPISYSVDSYGSWNTTVRHKSLDVTNMPCGVYSSSC